MCSLFAFPSIITWLLIIVLFVMIGLFVLTTNREIDGDEIYCDGKEPDGPIPLPVIGSLHLLARYSVPFRAFRLLANRYGEVFRIKLGSVPCVVVNGLDNIREVLMGKGDHFDGRPSFMRYILIFNGDKRNSLAFCDWSELQKTRRELLRVHTFPKSFSAKFQRLDGFINSETNILLEHISTHGGNPIDFKTLLLHTCANIFTLHFCSQRYSYDNELFSKTIYYFDHIFYEVNQGYAGDFMPWMLPFYKKHFDKIQSWTKEIRKFTTHIVNERYATWQPGRESNDYIDTLIETMRKEDDQEMNLEIAMFSLEDIIGGHAAIANFLMKVFAYIAVRPEVQDRIRAESKSVTKGQRDVGLSDRRSMPYTEAVILETIRLISSPIVPHVASQDSSIAGYKVKKGTMIFLNNYDLNYGSDLWEKPEQFLPERFLTKEGILFKPEHFFPFSTGRRSCMGYKMVQYLSFSILALILQRFQIRPVEGHSYGVTVGDLSLPYHKSYLFKFTKINVSP